MRKPIVKFHIVVEEEIDDKGVSTVIATIKSDRTLNSLTIRIKVDPLGYKQHLMESQYKDYRLTLARTFAGQLIDKILLQIAKGENAWNVS